MLTNYHTLGYVAAAFHALLRGRRIGSIFTQNPDEMVILFDAEVPALVFSCDAHLNGAYLQENFARARANTADVLPDACGASVSSVSIHPADRIILLSLGNDRRLLLQFFGPQANALLCASDGTILDAFRNRSPLIGQKPDLRDGEVTYDLSLFDAACRDSSTRQIVQVVRALYPALGATLTKEALHRAGVPAATPASGLAGEERSAIRNAIREILASLAEPRPRIYFSRQGAPKILSLVPLLHCADEKEELLPDLNLAIRRFILRSRAGSDLEDRLASLRLPLRNLIGKHQRTLAAMEKDAAEADRAADYERYGQCIMASLPSLVKGERILLAEGEKIQLDPARTPVQNAQRYFERAKKARTAAAEKVERITGAQRRINVAQRLLDALDGIADRAGLDAFTAEHAEALEEFGLTPRARERAQLPFRLFVVDGGFEVWAGKSNTNNDVLTMRHAKPDDLWFHARGSSGSHVVLKTATGKGEPGKKAKEQAAAIAAYYSKAKGASMVPVAMVERRYVRKPKGAPPGTVSIEREKVLFVRPELPHPEEK